MNEANGELELNTEQRTPNEEPENQKSIVMPLPPRMAGVKHHEDLVAWQLSESLRQAIVALLAKPALMGHRGFCDQISRSSSSAPANIAEGFSRYKPRDFARYMRIALGSLGETQNHLRAALNDKILSEEDFDIRLVTRGASNQGVKKATLLPSPMRQPRLTSARRVRGPPRTPSVDRDGERRTLNPEP